MLRQDPSSFTPDLNGSSSSSGAAYSAPAPSPTQAGGVDIQRELNRLEEMILDSPRIPLSRRTLVDEEQLLDQLDLVRINMPQAFREADTIAQHKEDIFMQAEHYAQDIIESAERRADQILDEMGIVQQAEAEARQIRQQVQQECEAAREQVMTEIERMKRQAQQELQGMRQEALAECEEIQGGADAYADRVLQDIEQQLSDMTRIIRNGRQQLQPEAPPSRPTPANPGSTRTNSSSQKKN